MPSTGIFVFNRRKRCQCILLRRLNASRAFLFSMRAGGSGSNDFCRLNALTGIFVFQSFATRLPSLPVRSQCPPRAFLFFNSILKKTPREREVSMPSRAFFVFQSMRTKVMICATKSQCPHGHFLFFNLVYREGGVLYAVTGLNALTGIFCFSISWMILSSLAQSTSQCPHGHFLFFNRTTGRQRLEGRLNALTGIFVFQSTCVETHEGDQIGLNALHGHFCFSITFYQLGKPDRDGSQCPHGHFCFSITI